MTIIVKDFSRATFVDVQHPDCEHPDNYQTIEEVGRGEITRSVVFCNVCKRMAIPDDEGDYIWEHEK